MDRIINTKTEQQSIYEIYRACRLCGAGAGYKMPIIQNVVDLDTSGIELTQKIRDCVQIEVHPDDKMPPLICELCVDKVNDFFEFVELCQRTNKRTRMRLGLPPQTSTKTVNSDVSSNSGDCILGVTEPVYQSYDSDEPLAPVTRRSKQSEGKLKVVKKEISKRHQKETKQKRPPTPPRTTRLSKASGEDSVALSKLKHQTNKSSNKTSSPPQPKSILKKGKDKREDSPVPTRSKRPREPPKPEVPQKKVKVAATAPTKPPHKPAPRSRRAPSPPPPPPPPPPPEHPCRICGKVNTTPQALSNHHRSHTVQYTSPKLACNACEEWFISLEEAQAHHRRHSVRRKPYRCRRCGAQRDTLQLYTDHIDNGECILWEGAPDARCPACCELLPARTPHACAAARPPGKCSKCRRTYSLLKNLKKHEATCTHKKKGDVIVDPSIQARIRPLQVRVSRCDALLTRVAQEHYDVSRVAQNYGLDRSCVYPYISSYAVKSELPRDSMVKIKAEIDDDEEQDFVHWDSDTESEEEAVKTVDTLSTLTLKKIFSKRCIGKVPRKRRKLKLEKNVFDSLLNASEFETSMSRDINNIIDNLGNDEDSWSKNIKDKNDDNDNGSDEESLLTNYVLFDNPIVTNNDNKLNVENSNDSQSIVDTSADRGNNENITNNKSVISTNDNDKMLDKDMTESNKETSGVSEETGKETEDLGKESDKEARSVFEESEIGNAQEISRVSNENNVESGETGDSNLNSNDNDTRVVTNNEDDTNEKEGFGNPNDEVSLETKEDQSSKNSAGVIIDDKQESTNNDRENSITEETKMDCSNDISVNVSSENTSYAVNIDTDTVNAYNDNTVDNKEIVSSNHSENAYNDTEYTKANTDTTNNCDEMVHNSSSENISNGEVEEISRKISYGDMNDISDTEIDDKKLMDALNEHIGENDKINEEINGGLATNHIEDKNQEAEVSNEQNGAQTENTTDISHKTSTNDHENAINDLIAENNDTATKNNDTFSDFPVSETNNFSESENRLNNSEADKISLEDLLPPKCDSKSMDLDSISDEDFDFDAC